MTEYRKNDKGIWLPDNIGTSNNYNEINWEKFKVNILNRLKFLSELLPLITVFSTVIGALSVYNYLKIINYNFLLSDIIGEPSSLIAIVIVSFLFFLLLSIGFLSPFLLNILSHTEIGKNNTYLILKTFHRLSISYIIFNFIFFIIAFFSDFNFGSFIYFSSFLFFIISICTCCILWGYYQVKITDSLIPSLLAIIPYCLYFSSSLYPIVKTVADKENFIWLVFIVGHLLIIFNSVMAIFYAKSQHKNQAFPTICIILVIFGYFHLIPYQNYEIALHKPKFIEKPQDSSWYLIHNGNTTSHTINGLTEKEVEKIKDTFIPKSWYWCKEDVFTQQNLFVCYHNWHKTPAYYGLNINPNTLYGYFAWNLGNTKVFCPQSVDFFDGTDNKEKSAQCFVIDGKYLQPISEYYLSK